MKNISKLLISASALLFASSTFAATPPICPPISMVANVQFFKAEQDMDNINWWDMISPKFSYQEQEWTVAFLASIPAANNVNEALAKGKNLYKTVTFKEPTQEYQLGITLCLYTEAFADKIVLALNPPVDNSNLVHRG